MAYKQKGWSAFTQKDDDKKKGSYSEDGKVYFPPASSKIDLNMSKKDQDQFFKDHKLESDTTKTTVDHGGGVTGTKTIISNTYMPTDSKKGWRKRRKTESPFPPITEKKKVGKRKEYKENLETLSK